MDTDRWKKINLFSWPFLAISLHFTDNLPRKLKKRKHKRAHMTVDNPEKL